MSPHMHLRGKSLKWVIVYPDGREQTILDVPKFDFNWQFNYELEEPLHIPAGSKILGIGIYDNSPKNKWNPAPHLRCTGRSRAGTRCTSRSREYSVDSQMRQRPDGDEELVNRSSSTRIHVRRRSQSGTRDASKRRTSA